MMVNAKTIHIINTIIVILFTWKFILTLPFLILKLFSNYLLLFKILESIFTIIAIFYLYFVIRAYKLCNLENPLFKSSLIFNILSVLTTIWGFIYILSSFGGNSITMGLAALGAGLYVGYFSWIPFTIGFILFTLGYFKYKN